MTDTRRHHGAAALLALAGISILAPAALSNDDGGTRSVFAVGAGNRALAMGGAYAAVADDASAPIWNPAGLGIVDRRQVQATHTSLYGLGFSEQYASFVLPSWRLGTASLTIRRFGVGEIDQRDDRNVILDEDLSDHETEIALGYGRRIGTLWSVGATVKLQRQSLAGYSDSGLGLDLGVLTRPLLVAGSSLPWAESFTMGLGIRNVVEPSIRLDEESVPDPTGLRLGFAYEHPFRAEGSILAALDIEKTADMGARLHTGLEVRVMPLLALRAGLSGGTLEAGTGVRWRDIDVDYVFENNELGGIHRFGVSCGFGPTVEESRQAALAAEEARLQERLAEAFESRNRSRIASLFAQVDAQLQDQAFDDALSTLSMIEVLDPGNERIATLQATALREKGLRLESAGDLAAAAVALGRALGLDPDDAGATRALDRVRAESNRRATRSLEIRALYERALAAYASDDLRGARDGFRRVVDADESDREAATMLHHTEDAISLRVADLTGQAGTLAAAGLFTEAEAAIQRARELDPGSDRVAQTTRTVADMRRDHEAQLARRRAEEARAQAAVTTTAGSTPGTGEKSARTTRSARRTLTDTEREEIADFYRRGLNAIEEGRADEAVRYWEFVWAADPGFESVGEYLKREYLTRGMEAFAAGRLHDAVADWERALDVDPDDQRARGYLARAHEQLTRYREIVGETRVATRDR